MTIQERYKGVIDYFYTAAPVAETELNYASPYELLVAVILSAQCTDKRVNQITPALFLEFPTVEDMAAVEPEDVFPLIRSCSYPNSKAKYLVGMARGIVERYSGQVPETREELMTLPGVGRKTANVITAVIYNQPTMAVDTHVFRVSNRIGLTRAAKTPLAVELALTKHIPKEIIPKAHHWLILHGRYICAARRPKCSECGITLYCRYYAKRERKKQRETKQQ